ncbi:MAG: nucleotidyl transferase AbiEii/AbiGii toxin family protein [Pseudonocardiaceae bacterium]
MDVLHELAARVGLAATGRFGFALAGGYAVQLHGFLERPSEDVDLFTVSQAESSFDEAVSAAVAAYLAVGLAVEIMRRDPAFTRLVLTDDQGRRVRVELGIDWRAHPPVQLDIGPVLHPDDAVANKLAALYGRAADRDYVDIDAVLRSGRYSSADLLRLAREADPGFDVAMFAQALLAVDRIPDEAFGCHGLTAVETSRLRNRMRSWANRLGDVADGQEQSDFGPNNGSGAESS